MRLLLDTQILLRTIYQPEKLPPELHGRLCDRDNDILFSAVSIAEIAIKSSLGRDDFPFKAAEVMQAAQTMSFVELPMDSRQAARLEGLPWHHRDPFDRMLIAQAIQDGLRLVTTDRMLAVYSELVELVR